MSVKRTEVSSVRFEINARPASVSMEALQAKADDLNKDIDIVKKNIADLGNVSPEHEGLKSYQKQLADLNKKLKDVQTTMKDYTRGVKAADELLKAYDAGNIESLSMKAIKAGQNGLKKRIENIKPETANEEELKAYRIITEVIRESQRVVDTFKTDAKETIEILEQGGTVAEATLKKTRDGVRDLMQTTKEGSKEYRDYQKQFEFLADKMKQMETESARVSGQKMLGRAFRGDFATADKKTLEEVIAKLREYQSVIDDPNGKGARIFAAAEKQIQSLSEQLAKTRGDIVSVEQALHVADVVTGKLASSVESVGSRVARATAETRSNIGGIDSEISSVNMQMAYLGQRMDKLGSKSTNLMPYVETLQQSNKVLQEQRTQRQEYIDTFKTEAAEREKDIKAQQEQIALMEKERDASIQIIEQRIKAQQENLAVLQQMNPQTETFLQMSASLEQEIQRLKEEKAAIENSAETKQRLAEANERLTAMIKANEEEMASSQAVIDGFDQKIAETQRKMDELVSSVPGFDAESIKAYETELTNLNVLLKEQQDSRAQFISTFEAERAERQKAIEAQKEQIALIEKERATAISSVNARLEAAQQMLAQLKELPAEVTSAAPVDEMIQTQLRTIRELQKERFKIASESEQRLAEMNDKLAASVKADEEAAAQSQAIIQQYDDQIKKLEKDIAEYTQKLSTAKSPIDKLEYDEATKKMGELQSQLSSLTAEREKYIAQMEREAEEATRLAEAEKAAAEAEQGSVSLEKMDQSLKVLEAARKKATDSADILNLEEAIGTLNQKIKEATGEWMSLADAEKLAEKAGENYYLSEGKSGFVASPEEIQKATQALERQRDALIKTIQTKKANKNATDEEKKALADEENKLQDLTKKLRDLKFEQDNVNMSQKKMRMLMEQPAQAVSLDELRAAIKRADGELRRMEGSLGKNSKEYKAFAEQVKAAKNTLKDMEGAAKASASAWEKAVSRLKTYVGLYMGFNIFWQKVTGTVGDLLTLSDKMGEVRKTTQMTADQVGRLSDALTKLDTRTSLTGLMEFSSLAGSIGLKTQEDVQGFTEAANMLSVSLPELGSEASRTLMKIADATGDLEKNGNNVRETLERVGSTVIALRANSAAAAGPITDFVSRVGAVGAQAGISIDQIAALGATVDALGGRVEMSATALSRMIPAIRNNTFEVAQAIGMTEKQLKSMSGIDQMVAVFKALHDSVKNFDMTTEEGMNAAADAVEGMLGRSVSMQDVMKQLNQQGARAGIVFGLLSQNVDTLEKQLRIAGDAYKDNTALMDEYNKMNDTAAAKWERLKNTIEEWFVSDKMQRILGDLIDIVRKFADWFGSDGPLATGFKMMIAYAMAMKVEFGAAFMGIGGGLKAVGAAFGSFVNVLATGATAAVGNLAGMTKGLRGLRMATIGARREWLKMDAAMKANIIGAVITAIGLLVYKLYDMHRASKEAAAEVGRFNQKMADERKALNSLFDPLNKSNLAQKERLDLIKQINDKYGRYLGYMLSETSSAIQLADAHALIAKRIREEAYEKRLLEQENKIKGEHEEDMSSRYGWIVEQAREGARGNADATAIADAIKSYIDKNLGNVENDFYFGSLRRSNESVKKLENGLNNVLERMVVDGKLTRDGAENLQKVAMQYLDVAKATEVDIEKHTSNLRSDLRGIQGAIQTDLANNLNSLVNNVINSANNIVRQMPGPVSQYLGRPEEQKGGLPSLFGGSQQGGWKAPWQQQQQTTPQVQKAPEGWKPNINKKDPAAVRQLVQDQDALRSGLQGYTGPNREAYESWLMSDKDLDEYRKLMQQQSRGPGGSNHNPYGDYDKVTSPYKDWNGNDLVARRKEMLERVKALADGADVQAVLSEDAKFISDAVRKNIKTTSQAIEWYNTERLKIQEALHGKHLTNTGDWQDPEKVRKRAGRVVQDEMKYYLDELDAYYTERKTRIEQARNDEEITEGEAWRRTIQNDNEWQTMRAELQLLYSRRAAKVTEDEMQAIFDIISERTGETVSYIKADIAQTNKFIVDVGKKSKAAMDRIYGDIELGAEKSYLKAAQAIGKQMKFIEETLAKERPYDGITKNLQDNLDKMGVLAAKYRRENEELARQGKEPKYSNEQITAQSYDEMVFYLRQAADAYSIDIDELLRRMVKEGMTATAEEISKSDMLKQAVMGQLRKTYQEVQDAIKKEASQIKKDVEIIWNDDARGIGGMSMKATFDKALAQLGMQQDSVSRANSLIGAGAASDNVASRLAMKQIEVQMRMQKAQYDMYRVQAKQRMAALKAEAEEHQRIAELEKQAGHEAAAAEQRTKAMVALRDAENVRLSLGLTLAEETKKEEEQKAELLKIQEESQNRLYTSLREWADLLTSSLQGVFEASNAGNAEYYNERAKLDLTGKGGPGAGTYIVIDDAGTSDAKAHYEYLDERQALERQHEIEIQNAQAEAWRKLWDDINMKMSEQITDWLNASLQDAAVKDNTDALLENTRAIYESMGLETGEPKSGQPDALPTQAQPDKPSAAVEPIVIPGGTTTTETPKVVGTDPENTSATNANTAALNTLTQVITGQPVAGSTSMGTATTGTETTATVEGDMSLQKPFFQMSAEETAAAMEMIRQMWQTYNEGGVEALQMMAESLAAMEGIVLPPWQVTEEGMATAMERMGALWQSYAEQGIAAMQQMSDAMAEMPNKIPDPTQLTEEHAEQAVQNATTMYQGLGEVQVQAQQDVTDKVVEGNKKQEQSTKQKDKQTEQSTKSTYSAMTAAMNMYGTAYQIMSNDNMDMTQKFQMFALQAAGQTAIGMLTTNMLATDAQGKVELPGILGKAASQLGPIAGPIAFAAMTALLGGLMAVAMSSVNKSKSQIAQVTGASVGAGRLSTGMLTYAEGNVNEFTDPASLTPGRQYNVDGADGKTYRARYMGKDAKTHITNGPEFHLVGEKGREAIIDAHTTRLMQTDDTGIWQAIQTLYNGGRVSGFSTRRGRGVRAFAEGNINDFEDVSGSGMEGAEGFDDLTAMQDSLDRNTAVQEALLERLKHPIVAQNVWTGPEGIPNMVNKYQKEAQRHGVKYL